MDNKPSMIWANSDNEMHPFDWGEFIKDGINAAFAFSNASAFVGLADFIAKYLGDSYLPWIDIKNMFIDPKNLKTSMGNVQIFPVNFNKL